MHLNLILLFFVILVLKLTRSSFVLLNTNYKGLSTLLNSFNCIFCWILQQHSASICHLKEDKYFCKFPWLSFLRMSNTQKNKVFLGSLLRIWSHLHEKSLMQNFFCAVIIFLSFQRRLQNCQNNCLVLSAGLVLIQFLDSLFPWKNGGPWYKFQVQPM